MIWRRETAHSCRHWWSNALTWWSLTLEEMSLIGQAARNRSSIDMLLQVGNSTNKGTNGRVNWSKVVSQNPDWVISLVCRMLSFGEVIPQGGELSGIPLLSGSDGHSNVAIENTICIFSKNSSPPRCKHVSSCISKGHLVVSQLEQRRNGKENKRLWAHLSVRERVR